jgi:EamA domain-containing membrane protein RarD
MMFLLLAIVLAGSGYKHALSKGSLHPVRRGAIAPAVIAPLMVWGSVDRYLTFRDAEHAEEIVANVIIWSIAFVAIVGCLGWYDERSKRMTQVAV